VLEATHFASGPSASFVLTEAAAPGLTTVFRITFIPHLLRCLAWVPISLPTEDSAS